MRRKIGRLGFIRNNANLNFVASITIQLPRCFAMLRRNILSNRFCEARETRPLALTDTTLLGTFFRNSSTSAIFRHSIFCACGTSSNLLGCDIQTKKGTADGNLVCCYQLDVVYIAGVHDTRQVELIEPKQETLRQKRRRFGALRNTVPKCHRLIVLCPSTQTAKKKIDQFRIPYSSLNYILQQCVIN